MTIDHYRATAFTDQFIFGFCYRGEIRFAFGTGDLLERLTVPERNSYRFRYNTGHRLLLMSLGSEVLCSKSDFDAMVAGSRYNRGQIFEKLVTEHFGQAWKADNIPYTVAGDIEIDGIAYQIKYEKAGI